MDCSSARRKWESNSLNNCCCEIFATIGKALPPAPARSAPLDLKVDQDNAEITVWYVTNRRPRNSKDGYTSQRDDHVHYGTCRVFVPESHKIGSTGSSFFKRLLTITDGSRRSCG